MKILHIAPNAPYNEGWGYQENLLPKYQNRLGHQVVLIIPALTHINGEITHCPCEDYINKDNVRVIRREYRKYLTPFMTTLFSHLEIDDILNEYAPDFIFFHGVISTTVFQAIKYKKSHPECVIVQDNHQDYQIGFQYHTLAEKLGRIYFRWLNRKSIRYIDRVYGVTPWRKTYAEEYFKIPSSKTDVLIMGADDENIDFSHRQQIKIRIREQYGISPFDYLVVTGGKIDNNKGIDALISACKDIPNVKLLVFGTPTPSYKETFERLLLHSNNIIYVGWISSDEVYDYFFSADLVVFPGQHSVLWEQACASKTPCAFKKWDGMTHVDNGGNSVFLKTVDSQSIRDLIIALKFTPSYEKMKTIAESNATDIYLYSHIAEKSLEMAELKD